MQYTAEKKKSVTIGDWTVGEYITLYVRNILNVPLQMRVQDYPDRF